MKIVSVNALKKTMTLIKTALAGKEPAFSKNSGFNLQRTDVVENNSLKVFTAKGALDLKSALESNINTKLDKNGYSGTANDLNQSIKTAQTTANSGVSKADSAQASANAANSNAESRLSKSGGTMNGIIEMGMNNINFTNSTDTGDIKWIGPAGLSKALLYAPNADVAGLAIIAATTTSFSAAGINCSGNITGVKTINAIWNDYAEYFPKPKNYVTEAGDIIALSESCDEEVYELATENHSVIVGAHSDQYGHLIGGDVPPEGEDYEEYNKNKYIPVGLVGRLPVKFTGVAKKGLKVVPSHIPGVGRVFDETKDSYDKVIGYIVENNNEEGIRRVKIKIGK
ncbi:MAG: alanine-zipper protein [Paraclostridium sp.]